MKSILQLPAGLVATLLLLCAPTTRGHTWVEQLTVIASNGTFVGTPGYPRGFVPRGPGVNADAGMVYLLPPNGRSTGNAILSTDLMCRSSQMIGSQTAGSPVLEASQGDYIALRYQENGHVTNPQLVPGKPLGGGIVYVYGTTKASNSDTYLGIHHVWNAAGTGGDGRGVLLATRHYDDGQCYQVTSNPQATLSPTRQKEFPHKNEAPMGGDIWCQTDIQLPTTAAGTYTLYWVWEWPTLDKSGAVFSNESYTTCMDVSVSPSTDQSSKAVSFLQGQDLNRAAISAQLANAFLINPTAAQQTDPAATAAPAANPTNAAAPAPAPATSQSTLPAFIPAPGSTVPPASGTAAPSSAAPKGFITVTVTASPAVETVYVTVNPAASQSTRTLTVSPFPASKTTITKTASASSGSRTTAGQSSSFQPASKSSQTASTSSGPPSVDPFLSPDSSTILGSPQTTPAAKSSYPPAPVPTTASFANGTKLESRYRVRGRTVRL